MSSDSRWVLCAISAFLLCSASFHAAARAQEPGPMPVAPVPMPEPPGPHADPRAPAAPGKALPAWPNPDFRAIEASTKPLPLEPIPDNPPPHEGAMIQLSYRIAPPDLLLVEVLEALPGRPIQGEHLVRPDGTISLGFYGDINVTGLKFEQAKIKIVLHLRKFITDQALGLVTYEEFEDGPAEPIQLPLPPDVPKKPEIPAEKKQADDPKKLEPKQPEVGGPRNGHFVEVLPENSLRVFVDVTAYNSKVYYVLGHVGSPGRLPATGEETVLDAIQFGGGVLGSGDRSRIKLYRPARGGQPAREYTIDLDAVERGAKDQNLQLFAGDRIVVPGRRIRE